MTVSNKSFGLMLKLKKNVYKKTNQFTNHTKVQLALLIYNFNLEDPLFERTAFVLSLLQIMIHISKSILHTIVIHYVTSTTINLVVVFIA